MRTISSTVEIKGGIHPRIPVKTNGDIPKEKIFEVMEEINKISVTSPVKCGDVLLHDVLGTGIDIVACRDMGANRKKRRGSGVFCFANEAHLRCMKHADGV